MSGPYFWEHGSSNDPVLLCLHGIGSCADAFIPQQSLAERCGRRVVAWDAPGYRHSADPEPDDPTTGPGIDGWADAAADLIRSLSPDRPADVLGVSWGGVTATRLVLRHPEVVDRLILADSSVGSGTDPDQAAAMRARASAVDELGLEEFAAKRSPYLITREAPTDLLVEVVKLMVDSVRMPPYQWAANSMADCDHRSDLAAVSRPTLVVVGAEDIITPPANSETLADGIPGAELVLIDGAGHLANQEQPDRFNDVVADFLVPGSG